MHLAPFDHHASLPCHGPNCSRAPDHLPAVPAPAPSLPDEKWGTANELALPPPPGTGELFLSRVGGTPVYRPFLLERPPR
jgi:hypothetical protein